jgi:hypothetical protein
MGHLIKAQRWFAHFADALAQGGDMFGAIMGVQAESHLELVDGLGGDAIVEDEVKPFEDVMISLEATHTLFHGETGLHGLIEGTKTGQRRKILVRRVRFHEHMAGVS